MVLAIVISALTIIAMMFFVIKIPKITIFKIEIQTFWIIPLISVILILALKLISFDSVIDGLTKKDSINPLKILILFFSMTFLSIVLDELGFFEYIAYLALKKTKKNQLRIFITLYVLTSFLTVFTSNDIIILTFTPFIIFFSKHAKISPIPYLVSEFVSANTWSMMFIIGNPTNIYLATATNISFVEYFLVMFVPTVMAGLTSFFIVYFIFRKELQKKIEIEEIKEVVVKDKVLLIFNIICLSICIIGLVISSYIELELYLVSAFFAFILFIIVILFEIINKDTKYINDSIKRIPWSLIPFVISMFIIVLTLNELEVIKKIGILLDNKYPIITYGISSTISCNLVNNIPMSVLYSKIIPAGNFGATYATIIGSNIGAFLTPIGALAGIMWLTLLKKYQIHFSFLAFMKYGVKVAIPTLLMALLFLAIIL